MPGHRLEQLAEVLRAELSDLMLREMKDPRLGFATITNVTVSRDLQHARISVSCYGEPHEQEETIRALQHASGFLRRALNDRIRLRTIPALTFRLDHSMAQAEEVQRVLRELAPELQAADAREAAATAAAALADPADDGDATPVEQGDDATASAKAPRFEEGR